MIALIILVIFLATGWIIATWADRVIMREQLHHQAH